MAERIAIPKSIRFNVFKRDGFLCQYCGSHPPKVILHVDHINPVSEGGTNDIDNLITACESCNLGKGARRLGDIPKSLGDKAAETEERESQIVGYNAILTAKAERLESEAWHIAAILEGDPNLSSYNRQSLLSIKRFLELLPLAKVSEAAEVAVARISSGGSRQFKYFCGVCWGMSRAEEVGHHGH